MQHIFVLCFIFMFSFSVVAQAEKNDSVPDKIKADSIQTDKAVKKTAFKQSIDMLDFEKERTDTNESFSLKNNTSHTITRVLLKLVYKTTDEVMIDNREIMVDGEVPPFSTKKFKIKSFDSGKKYRFHKSKITGKDEGKPFKVYFDLLRYDIAITE